MQAQIKTHRMAWLVALLSLLPAGAGSMTMSNSYAEDIGSAMIARIKPTVPPHAPRRSEKAPVMAGSLSGGFLLIVVPESAGQVDVTVQEIEGTGKMTAVLSVGMHLLPAEHLSGQLFIHILDEDGIIYDEKICQ